MDTFALSVSRSGKPGHHNCRHPDYQFCRVEQGLCIAVHAGCCSSSGWDLRYNHGSVLSSNVFQQEIPGVLPAGRIAGPGFRGMFSEKSGECLHPGGYPLVIHGISRFGHGAESPSEYYEMHFPYPGMPMRTGYTEPPVAMGLPSYAHRLQV